MKPIWQDVLMTLGSLDLKTHSTNQIRTLLLRIGEAAFDCGPQGSLNHENSIICGGPQLEDISQHGGFPGAHSKFLDTIES